MTKKDSVSGEKESEQIKQETDIIKNIKPLETNVVSQNSIFEQSTDIYELINSLDIEKLKQHINSNPASIKYNKFVYFKFSKKNKNIIIL